MKHIILGSILVLSACATTNPNAQAKADVAASQATLSALGKTILACYSVPACSAAAPRPKIRALYDSAYNVVVSAQAVADNGGTPNMVVVSSALAALGETVSVLQLPTK